MAEIIRLLGRYLDQSYPEKQELLQFPKAVLSLPLGTLQTSAQVFRQEVWAEYLF